MFPPRWSEPGFIRRLLQGYDPDNPEFAGPNGSKLKFAIGPIGPEPDLKAHQDNLRRISLKHGHDPIEIAAIRVCGKDHATIVYDILKPGLEQLLVLRFKNFHLIFSKVEYVVTAHVATLPRGISLTRPQALDLNEFHRQRAAYPDYQRRFPKIYACEEDYDDIIRTFRLV